MNASEIFDLKDPEAELHFLVREPKTKSDNPPLIILLHGVGSNEKDMFGFGRRLPDNFIIVSVRAPHRIGEESYAWFQVDFTSGHPVINPQQAEMSRTMLIQFISQLKEKYQFDQNQIYMCGFSQGGIMAYSVGLTRPDIVQGIAILSGRLLKEVRPLITPSRKLEQLKIFISHGTRDAVLNVQYAREALAYLKNMNIEPTYGEYEEGHAINNNMLADLIAWLTGK